MPSKVFSHSSSSWRTTFSLTIICLIGWLLTPTWAQEFTDRIVAVVNKEVITWSELQHNIKDEHSRLKAKYRGKELERRYIQKQREVLNQLIDERLLLQHAKKKRIKVSQEEIENSLKQTPLSPTQTEEEFAQELLLKKLFDLEVRRTIVVEDEEVRRHYDANAAVFRTLPQYRLKQILFPATEEWARQRAQTRAQAIYADWKPEIRIEDLAADHAQSVKELGWVEEKDLLSPIEQVLKEMTPNTLSTPIVTQAGVHLLIIDDVKASEPFPFDLVEREIHAYLLKKRGEEAYLEWMNTLQQQAFIDVRL